MCVVKLSNVSCIQQIIILLCVLMCKIKINYIKFKMGIIQQTRIAQYNKIIFYGNHISARFLFSCPWPQYLHAHINSFHLKNVAHLLCRVTAMVRAMSSQALYILHIYIYFVRPLHRIRETDGVQWRR